MQPKIGHILDPARFTVAHDVCALKVGKLTNSDGSFAAEIDETFIDRLVARMNEREEKTGDLAPLVIGHTRSGEREKDAPPVVGYARNWRKGRFGADGVVAAFFDGWVFNDDVPTARKHPRRSCELWLERFEADPISLLGASTPALDLGLMNLSASGSLVVESPGSMNMADEKKDEKNDKEEKNEKNGADEKKEGKTLPKDDKKEAGSEVETNTLLKQVLAGLQQVLEVLGGAAGGQAPQGPPPGPQDAGPGAEPPGGQPSDEDLESLIAHFLGGQPGAGGKPGPDEVSRAGEQPVKNSAGYPGGGNTTLRLSRVEQENEALRVQLSRRDVIDKLKEAAAAGKDVNPNDESLISDLVAMPPDMRERSIDRLVRLSRGKPGVLSTHADAALQEPVGSKRLTDENEKKRLIKLAREKGASFESVLRESGYTI